MNSVELYTGAGGLALGLSYAGFFHSAVVELNESACETLAENKRRGKLPIKDWPLFSADVRNFSFGFLEEKTDLLAAGVPCQPFSIAGKHKGHQDHRNLFPETLDVIRKLRPRAILIENVRGLKRPSFARYFEYIRLMITYPEIVPRSDEPWLDHLSRLERYHTGGRHSGLCYRVVSRVLNAADFGVPQKRERVFIVAIRKDLNVEWSFPAPTHSSDALIYSQYVTREYWDEHRVSRRKIPMPDERILRRVNSKGSGLFGPSAVRWRTVRDAISTLPVPARQRGGDEPELSHFLVEGARSYPGHTGSSLDSPAKTLKAGDHGVPGGENMLAGPNGEVRYFTLREAARLQTFPDEYVFPGSWTESMRQIGNAVPVRLAEVIAKDLRRVLSIPHARANVQSAG